jgi:hypothetical protein
MNELILVIKEVLEVEEVMEVYDVILEVEDK